MKIKTKLALGVGLLFVLIIVLTIVSTLYINALKKDTNNILSSNYNTLEYSRNMILALDAVQQKGQAVSDFQKNLAKQKDNETEPGEKEATDRIAAHFDQLKLHISDSLLKPLIRSDISEVMLLNMRAIEQKSEVASRTAETATIWIGITGTLCFLISFILLVNMPGNIGNPIKELTASIRQIAADNYHERVYFEDRSEFGELARSFNTMAEKLEEYAGSKLAQILMEKKRIDTLINNMHDPVIGLDENEKVLFANDEILKISGLKKDEFVGENIHKIALTNDLMRVLAHDNPQGTTAGTERQTLKIYTDSKESYFEKEVVGISIVPTGESERKQIGQVIILKNITPFKELDFAKTNFIATVSHELKTPISSIQMTIQLLKHIETGPLNEEQMLLLDSINDDSGRLLKITGELLNMTQVESGNMQLNIQPVRPDEILRYAASATKTAADQKKITLLVDADEPIDDILADAEKTSWVLTNFITNAIRYSPENSRIILSLKKKDGAVFFSVKDFGEGIESRYSQRVFDRYFRIPGSEKSGTGLGLAISRELIELQGGSIGLTTEQGVGSTFYFLFPDRV